MCLCRVPLCVRVCLHLCVCMHVHTCETCDWTGRCVPTMNVSILQATQAMAQAEQGPGQRISKAVILGAQGPFGYL